MANKLPDNWFLWTKMANSSPICFWISMPHNLYSNDGHNKLRGHISKNVAKITTNCLKISRAAILANLWVAITWPFFIRFWRLTTPKWSTHWDESISFRSDFGFLSHFLPPVATWATLGACRPKSTPRLSVLAQPITTNSLLKINAQ